MTSFPLPIAYQDSSLYMIPHVSHVQYFHFCDNWSHEVFDPIVHKQRNLPKIHPWSVILPQHTELCHLDFSRLTKMDREPPNLSETGCWHLCSWQHLRSSHYFITLLDGLWHTNQHKAGIQHIKQPFPNVRLSTEHSVLIIQLLQKKTRRNLKYDIEVVMICQAASHNTAVSWRAGGQILSNIYRPTTSHPARPHLQNNTGNSSQGSSLCCSPPLSWTKQCPVAEGKGKTEQENHTTFTGRENFTCVMLWEKAKGNVRTTLLEALCQSTYFYIQKYIFVLLDWKHSGHKTWNTSVCTLL